MKTTHQYHPEVGDLVRKDELVGKIIHLSQHCRNCEKMIVVEWPNKDHEYIPMSDCRWIEAPNFYWTVSGEEE